MKGALKGAALGALVASVAALLMAPKSGKKTRADLKNVLDSAQHDLQKKAKKMQALSRQQYEELFLNSLAHAAKKKEEIADILEDVTAVLKRGWDEVKRELKATPKIAPKPRTKAKR